MDDQNKNLILASVLSMLVLIVWFVLFPPPVPEEQITDATNGISTPLELPSADQETKTLSQEQVATTAEAARVAVNTPRLNGSISTVGARLDTVELRDFLVSLDKGAENVRVLKPMGEIEAFYSAFGWMALSGADADAMPTPDTIWDIQGADILTPSTPVTLTWNNGQGLNFIHEVSVDEDFLFTIKQSVENTSGQDVTLRPYGLLRRHGEPSDAKNFFILHEGVMRMSDGELSEDGYGDVSGYDIDPREGTHADRQDVEVSGWIGFTDHYWMSVLAPQKGNGFRSTVKYFEASDIYQTEAVLAPITVSNGTAAGATTQLFVGAKEWGTIRAYENAGIEGFLDSIDWGWFFFITKPMFAVLHWLNVLIGNMGWAIIGLTLLIKALLFPLAYKSYVSMAKMKELQPEMEKIKKQAGDDRQKMQQMTMKLYQEKKVNPAAGCLPILVQIPIFFSLYKVIFVTLELRHAPWFGWIKDLSAPDPSSIWNLFGMLPYSTPSPESIFAFVALGILPILLGISMWLQQKLNPAPTDPTQAMIFAWMPWVFMFMLGSFASGLVIYWIANNLITFTQQYLIMRSQGFKPNVFGNIRESFQRKKAD